MDDHDGTIDPYSVFVGQLHPDKITKEALLEKFGKYGNIVDCNLMIKPAKFGESSLVIALWTCANEAN